MAKYVLSHEDYKIVATFEYIRKFRIIEDARGMIDEDERDHANEAVWIELNNLHPDLSIMQRKIFMFLGILSGKFNKLTMQVLTSKESLTIQEVRSLWVKDHLARWNETTNYSENELTEMTVREFFLTHMKPTMILKPKEPSWRILEQVLMTNKELLSRLLTCSRKNNGYHGIVDELRATFQRFDDIQKWRNWKSTKKKIIRSSRLDFRKIFKPILRGNVNMTRYLAHMHMQMW
ncbi:PREDICTED: uncharacterized protein LOC104809301 [Tarenaya hassleriana]|uniref:uncharacterized protein LOC104809301 n=1 Tax=Tarenaya hassleriana TaxID=28532 RepID=UPI00053C7B93|nr:PREDICTED: uncharacterized protein LOC104809301 [Tarenaya hassleriana]